MDRKKARLEDLLNEFIELLVERAYAEKAAREKRAEDERRQEEAGERAREAERRTRAEEGRRDHFDRLVEHWRRNQERKAFLSEVRAAAGDVEPGSTTEPGYVPRTFCVPARVLNGIPLNASCSTVNGYDGMSMQIGRLRGTGEGIGRLRPRRIPGLG